MGEAGAGEVRRFLEGGEDIYKACWRGRRKREKDERRVRFAFRKSLNFSKLKCENSCYRLYTVRIYSKYV